MSSSSTECMVWFNNKTSFLPVVPQVSATVNVSTAYLTTRASSEFCATQGMSVFLCCDVVPYIEPEIEMYEWTVEYQGTTTALSSVLSRGQVHSMVLEQVLSTTHGALTALEGKSDWVNASLMHLILLAGVTIKMLEWDVGQVWHDN